VGIIVAPGQFDGSNVRKNHGGFSQWRWHLNQIEGISKAVDADQAAVAIGVCE
jgi:hypothetical protein